MQVSQQGRQYIESKEGLVLKAMRPLAGDVPTIGYGHTGPDVHMGLVWTKEQADAALTHRLATEFGPAVERACGSAPTTQGQFDAMASLAYNIGVGGLLKSSVARLHRQSLYDQAADAFELWDKFQGRTLEALHNRRVEEAQMYLDASPGYAEDIKRLELPVPVVAEPAPKPDGSVWEWLTSKLGL